MSSLLRQPPVETTFHRLGGEARQYVDPATQACFDDATEQGYRRGLVDGAASAQQALVADRDRALSAVEQATRTAHDQITSGLTSATKQMVTLAFDLAELIAGRAVEDDGAAIAERVASALDQMDDEDTRLLVSSSDEPMFSKLYGTDPNLAVTTDPRLQAGEAVVQGRWSHADLTYTGIRRALEQQLDA